MLIGNWNRRGMGSGVSDLLERLTYHALRAMPMGWIAHQPLTFEGLHGGYIARISGGTYVPNAARLSRHYEIEGYGQTPEAAVEDLLRKIEATR